MLVLERVTTACASGCSPALEDITLSVQPGRCLGVLGQAGSGKSALAGLLAGILPIAAGEVRPPATGLHQIAIVPQSAPPDAAWVSALLQHIAESVGRPGPMSASRGNELNDPDADPRLDLALQFRELRPAVLVLDEPDAPTPARVRTWKEFISGACAQDCAVLVLSRHESLLGAWCDELAVLFDGRVIAAGPLDSVAPAARSVAKKRYGL